ncbi:MAG: bifunctional phosphoribosylaminoimidazolecarboxamide formyltransferase/IMP cyclohydrolase [Planctomycetes bacterium]|jgi:phosphoribosylaminoimidazolecarboxamide formyltransferase/IMP cyclohydrolase|nr:bifunctional phosphoribosylaminoimidazolecarboxamide formyltransferase/IMP cyclohydrolase [Planctomycetota bacterium]MCL4729324.1 bifunctional phosphoribosylaminoimidazolecarboxamide formyltransferase/IMP cyclohydrolase [Planctomycetota bacterium]
MDRVAIRRVLVSVSDKTGVVDFCKALAGHGAEFISTGGTAKALREAGLAVKDISEHTGFPEMLDGRVKTLHPRVHGGLLARRDLEDHRRTAEQHGIGLIDMVIVNLYPFESTVAKPGVSFEDAIENIDIGGPSMVRSASKNHEAVAVVTDPADYAELTRELAEHGGKLGLNTRRRLALKAFRLTSWYDHAIAQYLQGQIDHGDALAGRRLLALERVQELRYGENPHQQAAFYATGGRREGLGALQQLSGKELSYNNILDLDAAMRVAAEYDDAPFAVVIKHTNPCGAALADSIAEAFTRSYDCDPLSAFGGIVGLNRPFDLATAAAFVEGEKFLEAVVAPDFEPAAVKALVEDSKKKWRKSIRLVKAGVPAAKQPPLEYRSVVGGMLAQTSDSHIGQAAELKVVTNQVPNSAQMKELAFAWRLCKHYKSNAIVLTAHRALIGYGAGQTNRVDSTEHALTRAGAKARGAVLASDAFFPFPDSIEKAARAGVAAIIQPGGSVRDEDVIAACNQHGIAMVFTGMRHFRH